MHWQSGQLNGNIGWREFGESRIEGTKILKGKDSAKKPKSEFDEPDYKDLSPICHRLLHEKLMILKQLRK